MTSQSCTTQWKKWSLLKTYKKCHTHMTQRIKLPLFQGIGAAINRPAFFFLDRYNPRSWILPLSSFLLQIVLIYNWKNLGSDFSQNFDLGGAHGHTFIKKKKKNPKNSRRSHKITITNEQNSPMYKIYSCHTNKNTRSGKLAHQLLLLLLLLLFYEKNQKIWHFTGFTP